MYLSKKGKSDSIGVKLDAIGVSASIDNGLLSANLKDNLSTSDILFYLKSPIDCTQDWAVSAHYYYGTMAAEVFE